MLEDMKVNIKPHEVIFSLDIGTKSVVGIIGKYEEDKFKILDYEILKHPSRAMYDGQIHDVQKVSNTCNRVKSSLEERLGFKLKKVSIAAAGRALKTVTVVVQKEVDPLNKINRAVVTSLEIEGVQKAEEILNNERKDTSLKYYCVGHTVKNYLLDDNIMSSLIDHKGNEIGAEIIATFLPYVVVDSLYTVMSKIDLEVESLTLEPIAAINVAIAENLRLLNMALVDIGAGTSDIAITKDGNIVAYAMVSKAGDEITEVLAKEFLLDFNSAEELKIQLNKKDNHTFSDIVGIEYTLTTEEIMDKIKESVQNLAENIGENILKYNKKAPSAVFCIGGGSQIPNLTQYLAQKLEIKPERVVVRGTEILQGIDVNFKELSGPEFITPIGIGTIGENIYKDMLKVSFNNESVELFKTKNLKISDVLIKVGFSPSKLISKRGDSINIICNNEDYELKGDLGQSAVIYLNNQLASIDTEISYGDCIVVQEATKGKQPIVTLKDFLNKLEIKTHNIKFITVNDIKVDLSYNLLNKDNIIIKYKDEKKKIEDNKGLIKVLVNDEEVFIKKKDNQVFVDILDEIHIDTTKAKGKLFTKINGLDCGFTDEIHDDDRIEIYWE